MQDGRRRHVAPPLVVHHGRTPRARGRDDEGLAADSAAEEDEGMTLEAADTGCRMFALSVALRHSCVERHCWAVPPTAAATGCATELIRLGTHDDEIEE